MHYGTGRGPEATGSASRRPKRPPVAGPSRSKPGSPAGARKAKAAATPAPAKPARAKRRLIPGGVRGSSRRRSSAGRRRGRQRRRRLRRFGRGEGARRDRGGPWRLPASASRSRAKPGSPRTRAAAASGFSSPGHRASKGPSRLLSAKRRSASHARRAPARGRRAEERMGGCAEGQG